MTELEHAIKHIKTRADAWAVKEVTEALQSISERLDKALSQEPCTDAVSREDAIESIANIDETDGTVAIFTGKQVIALLKDLPSVNAIQHTNTLGDAVSREAVLDAIKRISLGQTDVVKVSMMTEDYVEKLPSVTQKSGHFIDGVHAMGYREGYKDAQKQKSGKWIETDDKYGAFFICDKCHRQSDIMENFCPNCGAKMESEEQTE